MPQLRRAVRAVPVLLALLAGAPRAGAEPAAAAAQPQAAPTAPKVTSLGAAAPKTALWIGNSFFFSNDSLHDTVLGLVKAADAEHARQYRATSITISGSGLSWHDVESYFRPGGVGSFAFAADNEVVFSTREKPFDVVIMQDCSRCPVHPRLKELFHDSVRKDARIVRSHGAIPVLFMTWAYSDRPEMTAQLAEQYTLAGNANDALVIPAGLAFAKARARDPNLELYQPDRRHPTAAGSYLAACTTYAAIWGRSPVGISFTRGIDPKLARFLQEVAWETVREYLGKGAT
jgi:hypothetical protein